MVWRHSKPPEVGEKEEEVEEKKEDDYEEEEMEGKQRDEEDMHDRQIPLGPFCHFCSSCFKVLSRKKKLNQHTIEIHKDPTS